MNTHTTIMLIIAVVSCIIACGGVLWRLSRAISKVELQAEVNRLGIEACNKDISLINKDLDHFDEVIKGVGNQFKEAIDHARKRLQEEDAKQSNFLSRLNSRVESVESFLSKTTTFEKR